MTCPVTNVQYSIELFRRPST